MLTRRSYVSVAAAVCRCKFLCIPGSCDIMAAPSSSPCFPLRTFSSDSNSKGPTRGGGSLGGQTKTPPPASVATSPARSAWFPPARGEAASSFTSASFSHGPAEETTMEEFIANGEEDHKLPPLRVMITGASSQIAQAIDWKLRYLGRRGRIHHTVLVSRSRDKLTRMYGERTIAEAEARDGSDPADGFRDGHVIGVELMDVGIPKQWDSLVEKWPNIDVLINLAAHLDRTLLVKQDISQIDSTIRTNLIGPIYGSRVYAKAMMRRQMRQKNRMTMGGVIINIASVLAVRGGQGAVAYAASKAGVVGLTRALTTEVTRHGVRVNAILPGWIDSGMGDMETLRDTLSENWLEQQQLKIPLQRFGTPAEVADAVSFLIHNHYAAGCVLNLDGGLSAAD